MTRWSSRNPRADRLCSAVSSRPKLRVGFGMPASAAMAAASSVPLPMPVAARVASSVG